MLTAKHIMSLKGNRKLSMITCYDYASACLVRETAIDMVLVGDSVAMTMYGHASTIHATPEMMRLHVSAVARGCPDKFIVCDLPFLSFRKGVAYALDCAGDLLRAGAHAVKVEGVRGHCEVIRALVYSGIPVMGHLGLTPQAHLQLGGFKVQGRTPQEAVQLKEDVQQIQDTGIFALVLECIPAPLARDITHMVECPTIGIGAGNHTDGQVLVWHDVMGLTPSFKPKFVRHFARIAPLMTTALDTYHQAVLNSEFPTFQELYHD